MYQASKVLAPMLIISKFSLTSRRGIQSLSHKRFNQTATIALAASPSSDSSIQQLERQAENVDLHSYKHAHTYNDASNVALPASAATATCNTSAQQAAAAASAQCCLPINETLHIDKDVLDLSFNNTRVAFKSKKSLILLRDYIVLSLCSSNTLVKNNDLLMDLARRMLGKRGFELLMRATFYGQFVAGRDEHEIKPVIEHLNRFGVKALIDYGAEEDVGGEKNSATTSAVHCVADNSAKLHALSCDKNLNIFLRAIDTVSSATNGSGIVAIKLTALGKPQLLVKLSQIIKFMQVRPAASVDFSNVAELLNEFQAIQKPAVADNELTLDDSEEEELCNLMRRVNKVASYASENKVRCMIDAEQTYMQPAINMLALEMMRAFNRQTAIIFNTYQCYLKNTFDNVLRDLRIARRDKFVFSAKLVRGAYIEQERERALRLCYEDPISSSYDATTQMYEQTLGLLITEIGAEKKASKQARINIMVASHNEDTIRFAVQQMAEQNIKPDDKLICFGLLYGMSDHVSFSLGQAGYSTFKYMPYGPLNEVLPYIGRRAIENNGFLGKLNRQRSLIAKELGNRLFGLNLFHKPTGNYKPA